MAVLFPLLYVPPPPPLCPLPSPPSVPFADMLVVMLHLLVRCGAILPGSLSGWCEELKETPDHPLALEVVGLVMSKSTEAS